MEAITILIRKEAESNAAQTQAINDLEVRVKSIETNGPVDIKSSAAILNPQQGGTGIDTSNKTGGPYIVNGVWEVRNSTKYNSVNADAIEIFSASSICVVKYEILGVSGDSSCYLGGVVKFHPPRSLIVSLQNAVDTDLSGVGVSVSGNKLILKGIDKKIDWTVSIHR